MTIVFLVIAALLAIYTLSPFLEKGFRNRRLSAGTGEQENLRYRKEGILEALTDLEYDFKMKKMNEPDYMQLKEKLTREAIEVMKKLDEAEQKSDSHADRVATRTPNAPRVRS